MTERWRSKAARELVRKVRKMGGTAERMGNGKVKITGPDGSVTVQEPPNTRGLRGPWYVAISGMTGLKLQDEQKPKRAAPGLRGGRNG